MLVLLSAMAILYAAIGPLRATGSARLLRLVALVQFAVAGVLALARLTGFA